MIQIKKLSSDFFPTPLREIPEPPEELYLRGELPDEKSYIYLTVVGSRKYSRYGKDACEQLISGLRGYPIVIVSGLALGIDGIAHKSAMEAGLKTIAVPGSGLSPQVLYPRTHVPLAEEIIDSGGALLSEFEPDFRATEWSFPQRNRIMAGISKATLVIEAEDRSGTLITARMALDYNRDVLAVPGDIFSPTASGTNRLIKQGAGAITSPEDLLRVLGFEPNNNKNIIVDISDLSPNENTIWNLLVEPISRDQLIRESGLSIQDCIETLSLLEIKGVITEEMGEIRRKA